MSENNLVKDIKDRLSIEEVVSWYLKLEKTGINMKARCPFHNEKTPSFFVSPDRGSFYCFGCSKGGDIFSFVQEIENINFVDALKLLTEKAGLDISKYQISSKEDKNFSKENIEKEKLYEILERATIYFEKEINNDLVIGYLSKRGIKKDSIKKFRIGYAKDGWQNLYEYLKKEKYTDEQLLKTGLFVKNENGRIYDRFRGRVIFPIFDEKGKVIAYSARILTDSKDQPKYINSPETILFNKSKILYGFNFAKQIIRKHDFAILVEGQMDVILTHQIGYSNSVASSGTAFTEDQLKLIKRYTNNLLISFDGDGAGINSSKKVWEMALKNEMDVKIVPLESGNDPASIICESESEWRDIVKKSKHIILHLAHNIDKTFADRRKKQKEMQIQIYPYLRNINSYTDKSFFVESLSTIFAVDKDAIWADINNSENNSFYLDETDYSNNDRVNPVEVLYGMYLCKDIKQKENFLKLIKEYVSEDVLNSLEKRKDQILFKTELLIGQYENIQKLAEDMLKKTILENLDSKKEEINNKLKLIKDGSKEEALLMKEIVEIKRKYEDIRKNGCQNLLNMI